MYNENRNRVRATAQGLTIAKSAPRSTLVAGVLLQIRVRYDLRGGERIQIVERLRETTGLHVSLPLPRAPGCSQVR